MKILLVDDDGFMRELIRSVLEPEGFEVTACGDVDQGISALGKEDFDLIISDMVMPGKTGPDFMEHIKRSKINVPVLAITAGVENAVDEYVNYADLFADETMAKPFVHKELVATVRRMIEEGRKKSAAQ